MTNPLSIALLLLCAASPLALAGPLTGDYSLEGRDSAHHALRVELSVSETSEGRLVVSRSARYTGERQTQTPPLHWKASRVERSGRFMTVTYFAEERSQGGLSGALVSAPRPPAVRHELRAYYMFFGKRVREFVVNLTRRGALRWKFSTARGEHIHRLTTSEVVAKAKAHVLANVASSGWNEAGKLYPALDSGEEGLDAVVLSDKNAEDLVSFFRANTYSATAFVDLPFDSKNEVLLVVRDSPYVEKNLYVARVSRTSGTVEYIGRYYLSNLKIDNADLERFIGPVDGEFADEEVSRHVARDGVRVDLGNPNADW